MTAFTQLICTSKHVLMYFTCQNSKPLVSPLTFFQGQYRKMIPYNAENPVDLSSLVASRASSFASDFFSFLNTLFYIQEDPEVKISEVSVSFTFLVKYFRLGLAIYSF